MWKLLILLLVCTVGVRSECEESDQIQCRTNDKCTRIQYVCDGDNDCGDYSDENGDLCGLWRNSDCGRGEAICRRGNGSPHCTDMKTYCDQNAREPCVGNVDMRLCHMLRDGRLQILEDITLATEDESNSISDLGKAIEKGEDFLEMAKHTLDSDKCPKLFTRIGEDCISVFFFGNLTWGEARSFCKDIGGDLFMPEVSEEFHILVRHLKKHHITADFWIGGSYNESTGWRWINDEHIELDTPHWALRYDTICHAREMLNERRNETELANRGHCYHYNLAPAAEPRGRCVASTYGKFFFLSDENCLKLKSPLCKIYEK